MKRKRNCRVVNILTMGLIVLLIGIAVKAKPRTMRLELPDDLYEQGYRLTNPTGGNGNGWSVNWDKIKGEEESDVDSNLAKKERHTGRIYVTGKGPHISKDRALWLKFNVIKVDKDTQTHENCFRGYVQSGYKNVWSPLQFHHIPNNSNDHLKVYEHGVCDDNGYTYTIEPTGTPWHIDNESYEYNNTLLLPLRITEINPPTDQMKENLVNVMEEPYDYPIYMHYELEKLGFRRENKTEEKIRYDFFYYTEHWGTVFVNDITYAGMPVGRVVVCKDDPKDGETIYKATGCCNKLSFVATEDSQGTRFFVDAYLPPTEINFNEENFDENQLGFRCQKEQDGFRWNKDRGCYELDPIKTVTMTFPGDRSFDLYVEAESSKVYSSVFVDINEKGSTHIDLDNSVRDFVKVPLFDSSDNRLWEPKENEIKITNNSMEKIYISKALLGSWQG